MKNFVVDASYVAAFLLKETAAVEKSFSNIYKLSLSKSAAIYSSPILTSELTNILRFKFLIIGEATDVLRAFFDLPILSYSLSSTDWEDILKLSYELNTTAYDTSYHFVAQLLGGTFLTCDKKYFQKAKKLGAVELIY